MCRSNLDCTAQGGDVQSLLQSIFVLSLSEEVGVVWPREGVYSYANMPLT